MTSYVFQSLFNLLLGVSSLQSIQKLASRLQEILKKKN